MKRKVLLIVAIILSFTNIKLSAEVRLSSYSIHPNYLKDGKVKVYSTGVTDILATGTYNRQMYQGNWEGATGTQKLVIFNGSNYVDIEGTAVSFKAEDFDSSGWAYINIQGTLEANAAGNIHLAYKLNGAANWSYSSVKYETILMPPPTINVNLTMSGPSSLCVNGSGAYTIYNLPSGATITWTVEGAAVKSSSPPIFNSYSITGTSNGRATVNAIVYVPGNTTYTVAPRTISIFSAHSTRSTVRFLGNG